MIIIVQPWYDRAITIFHKLFTKNVGIDRIYTKLTITWYGHQDMTIALLHSSLIYIFYYTKLTMVLCQKKLFGRFWDTKIPFHILHNSYKWTIIIFVINTQAWGIRKLISHFHLPIPPIQDSRTTFYRIPLRDGGSSCAIIRNEYIQKV